MDDLYIYFFTKIISTEVFVVVALGICLYLLYRFNIKESLLYLGATTFLLVATSILKNIFTVARPPHPLVEATGYAFPSGHATASIFLSLTIIFLSRNRPKSSRYIIKILSISFAVLVGISRLQLGVHTLSQVLAGYVLGTLCFAIYIFLRKYYK